MPTIDSADKTLATDLTEHGATPVEPDMKAIVAELQKQIDAQKTHLESLLAEKGQSSNPVAQAVLNLWHHVKARAAANPGFDLSELQKTLEDLQTNPESVTTDATQLIKEYVADALDRGRHLELHYLEQLARDLHKAALKNA